MSEKFRIALIGTGMICNCAHLPAINNLRKKGLAEIVACADIREEAAKETAERWNIPEWYTDPQEMLDKHKDKLDIVAGRTPNLAHKTWSIAALKAGANVMCEKPLALTYRDAKEMFAVADACGKVLFPCQSRRWTKGSGPAAAPAVGRPTWCSAGMPWSRPRSASPITRTSASAAVTESPAGACST